MVNKKISTLAGSLIILTIVLALSITFSVRERVVRKEDGMIKNKNNAQVLTNIINSDIDTYSKFKEKPLISFVRDGDIWLYNFSNEKEIKLTSHNTSSHSIKECPTKNCPQITKSFDNNYYSLPTISPDIKFIVYSCLSNETMDNVIKSQNKILTSKIEPKYDICINDLNNDNKKVISIQGNPTAFNWSNDGNFLAVATTSGPRLVIIAKDENDFKIQESFSNKGNFYSFKNIKWSPDNKRILMPAISASQTRKNVSIIRMLDINTKIQIEFSENSSNFIFMGDWISSSKIIYAKRTQENNQVAIIEKNLDNAMEVDVFIPEEFNWNGFIELSPNKEYYLYVSKANQPSSIDHDITLWKKSNQISYVISSLFPTEPGKENTFIAEHKWLPDNSLIFSKYTADYKNIGNQSPEIWRLYPESKELEFINKDAFIFNSF